MKLVFVSSTFRDMQFERDALNTRVVPRINQFLERYSETVHFGDLRWGVNTTELESEESSKKVLKVCLDQIDDCKPYMIIFIGERYGWIPSRDLLHSAALLKGMDVSSIKEDTSVTELEIEYGALLNPDYEGRILFYFRNPFDMSEMTEEQKANYISESPLHKEKIEQLKAQIKEKYPDYIRYYDVSYDADAGKLVGLEPLMDQIYEDLQRVFDLDLTYLNSLPTEERALSNSKNHFEKMAADSYLRELSAVNQFDYDAFEYYYQMRFENNPAFEVVTGPHGIGAKTLVAQKYMNTLKAGYNAVCFSFGMDEFTDTVDKMVATVCYRLEEMMELPHDTKASAEHFAHLCKAYTERLDLPYLYFYMVNLPVSALTVFRKLEALHPYLFGVGFCVHFRKYIPDEMSLPFFLKNRVTRVPALSTDEIGEMVNAILKSKRKELPPIVIDEIKKHSAANLPLYLSLLVERLLILDNDDFAAIRARGDGMDNINAYMIDLIRESGDNVTEIAKELLEELAERINPVMIPHLVAHIALPNHFKEDYIQEFFTHQGWNYSALDFTLFKKTFPSLVYQNVLGYLYYTNDDVKLAAQQLAEEWGADKDVSAMMSFMDAKPIKEIIKAKMLIYRYVGDAKSFVDCALTYMDGARYQEDQIIGERCLNAYFDVMTDEIRDNSDFALSVSKSIFDAIAQGRVQYPYDMVAYFLQCIPSHTFEAEDVNQNYDFLVQLEAYLAELRKTCDAEVLAFTQFLLCASYMMPMVTRMVGPKAIEEANRLQSYMRVENPYWGKKVLQIIWEKKLPLVDVLRRSSTEMFRLFEDVLCDEKPARKPKFKDLYSRCKGFEEYLLKQDSQYYESILAGDIQQIQASERSMHALLLVMWGFCCYKIKKIKKAKNCYDAFYVLFSKHFKDNPPDWWDRAIYIKTIKNYCQFLIDHEDEETAKTRLRELFAWCISQMAEPPMNFDTACELMELHRLVYDHIQSDNGPFSPIFGLLLSKAPVTIIAPRTALNVLEYYRFFSSLLTVNEREYYFIELTPRLVKGMLTDLQWEALGVVDFLCEGTVDFCLTNKLDIGKMIEKVICRVVDENPEVFTNDKQEYIAAGMQLCMKLLEERG